MGSLYGDVLLSFTEQMEKVPYYKMDPAVNSGFTDETYIKDIKIIRHNSFGGLIKDSNGNLVRTQSFQVWSRELLIDGYFVKIDDEVFRVSKSNNWKRQGGFIAYDTQKVIGDDNTLTVDVEFNKGEDNFK